MNASFHCQHYQENEDYCFVCANRTFRSENELYRSYLSKLSTITAKNKFELLFTSRPVCVVFHCEPTVTKCLTKREKNHHKLPVAPQSMCCLMDEFLSKAHKRTIYL